MGTTRNHFLRILWREGSRFSSMLMLCHKGILQSHITWKCHERNAELLFRKQFTKEQKIEQTIRPGNDCHTFLVCGCSSREELSIRGLKFEVIFGAFRSIDKLIWFYIPAKPETFKCNWQASVLEFFFKCSSHQWHYRDFTKEFCFSSRQLKIKDFTNWLNKVRWNMLILFTSKETKKTYFFLL